MLNVETRSVFSTNHNARSSPVSSGFRLEMRKKGESDHGEVSLEVGARFLNLHLFGGDVGAVAGFDGLDDGVGEQLFDVHCMLDSEFYICEEKSCLTAGAPKSGDDGIMVGKVDLVVDIRFDSFKQGIGEQMIDAHVHGIAVEGARNAIAGGTKRVVESEIDKAMTGGGDGGCR